MPFVRKIDQGEPDDTEGNGRRGVPSPAVSDGIADGTEDTEGNMPLRRGLEDGIASESDDAEGNGRRGIPSPAFSESDDDTEGNGVRIKL